MALVLKGKSGQPLKPKPVNNTRTDTLGTPLALCQPYEGELAIDQPWVAGR